MEICELSSDCAPDGPRVSQKVVASLKVHQETHKPPFDHMIAIISAKLLHYLARTTLFGV